LKKVVLLWLLLQGLACGAQIRGPLLGPFGHVQSQVIVRDPLSVITYDQFYRSVGGLGSNWSGSSNLTIVASQAAAGTVGDVTTGSTSDFAYFTGPGAYNATQCSQISVAALPVATTGWIGLSTHQTSSTSFYALEVLNSATSVTYDFYSVSGGTFTAIGSPTSTGAIMAVGDAYQFCVSGSTLTAYRLTSGGTFVSQASQTSSAVPGPGYPGIGLAGTSPTNPAGLGAFQTSGLNTSLINDSTLDSNWTALSGSFDTGTVGITDDTAQVQSTGAWASSFWNANSFTANQYAEAIAGGTSSGGSGSKYYVDGVSVHASSSDNRYHFTWNIPSVTNEFQLLKVSGGVTTSLMLASQYTNGMTATESGSTVTATYTGGAYLNPPVGSTVVITGFTPSGYNGSWVVTAITPNTSFQYTDTNTGLGSGTGGQAQVMTNNCGQALGRVMRLEIVGTTINAYYNGCWIMSATDSTLAAGSPGLTSYIDPTDAYQPYLTDWEGGTLLWTRRGTVIPVGSGGGNEEPQPIYEAGCVIVSSPCFKMWTTYGWSSPVPTVYYYESSDGINFTSYSGNPVISNGSTIVAHGYVFHYGSTYYGYYSNNNEGGTFDQWTSPDGVTWTLAHHNVLTDGSIGQFDSNGVYNPVVWVNSGTGTWYMIYTGELGSANPNAGSYSIGLATSSDGVTWTKYSGNPIITNGLAGSAANGKSIAQYGGNWYLWGFTAAPGTFNLPTDISVWESPDLHNWTPSSKNPIYERVLVDEGVGLVGGQVADPAVIQLGGMTYLYYDTIDQQIAGHIHINLATAPYPLSQITLALFP